MSINIIIITKQVDFRKKGKSFHEQNIVRLADETVGNHSEMRMLRWIKGVTLRDTDRGVTQLGDLEVENITFKDRQARLRLYGHILRMDDGMMETR